MISLGARLWPDKLHEHISLATGPSRMPLLQENTRVLLEAGSFLLGISQEPELPEGIRRTAQAISNRFPTAEEIFEDPSCYLNSGQLSASAILAASGFEPDPGLLTERKKTSWLHLKKSLHLTDREKENLSKHFLSSRQMQEIIGINEDNLRHKTELRWFLSVPNKSNCEEYPDFQLLNSRPVDAVAEIFSLFDRYADGWDDPWIIVSWFYRPNTLLLGKTPADVLASDAEAVANAAAEDLSLERLEA